MNKGARTARQARASGARARCGIIAYIALLLTTGCLAPTVDTADAGYIEYADALPTQLVNPVNSPRSGALDFADFADAGSFSAGEEGFYIGGVNAEQSAAEAFDRGGVESFSVATLSESADQQTLLVTRLGLTTGAVKDERLLLLFRTQGGEPGANVPAGIWRVVRSGRQVRCHTGLGHSRWSAQPCK